MRRVERSLRQLRDLHELLVIIGRYHPAVEDLRALMGEKAFAQWTKMVRKDRLIKEEVRMLVGERTRIFSVTDRGYAFRGWMEDHWDLMVDYLSFSLYSRLPSRRWKQPQPPPLHFPREPAVEKFFQSRRKAKVERVVKRRMRKQEKKGCE